jgi:hypothetical protein
VVSAAGVRRWRPRLVPKHPLRGKRNPDDRHISRFYGGGLSDFSKLEIGGWDAALPSKKKLDALCHVFFAVFTKHPFFTLFYDFLPSD